MTSEQAQIDGLASNLIDSLSPNLACFVCGGWPVPGLTPLDLKLARAKEYRLSYLEDIVIEVLFVNLMAFSLKTRFEIWITFRVL